MADATGISVSLTALATARCHLARRMVLLLWNLHLNDVQVTRIGINSHNHRHVLVLVILQRVGVVHLVLLAVRVIGKGLAVGADFARHVLIILGIGLVLLTLVGLVVILLCRVLSHGHDWQGEGKNRNADD